MSLSLSSPEKEGLFQASKWTKVQALLDAEEMAALLQELGNVSFAIVSKPISLDAAIITPEQFLLTYRAYSAALQAGHVPDTSFFRPLFSSVLTHSLEALYAMEVGKDRYLIKPRAPVIQLQAHHFFYSPLDGQFHSMVLSPDSISWGLQFSYPQWIQDPASRQIQKVRENPAFVNTALFSQLMRWMRTFTLPTPLIVEGQKINAPLRIGKKVLPWIKNHVQLKEKKIEIFVQ